MANAVMVQLFEPSEDGVAPSSTASLDEVRSAIESLTDADLLRLEQVAVRRLRWLGVLDPQAMAADLINESVRRLLERRRTWRPDRVGFLELMRGIIWSIANDWGRMARSDRPGMVALGLPEEGETAVDGVRDPALTQEEELLRRQREAAVWELFAGDPASTAVLSDLLAGFSFRDIRERRMLDDCALQATLKRIRRRVSQQVRSGTAGQKSSAGVSGIESSSA